ncbi:MAG: C39 family peptidase [Clostridia bacterium]|nr:C39 family peptidase [Clostridia bacterium]
MSKRFIVKYLLFFAVTALILIFSFLVFKGGDSFALNVKTAPLSAGDIGGEAEALKPSGLVPINDVRFLNERYIRLTPGGTYKIGISVEPEDANESIMWESDNESVATVSSDGVVTGIMPGEAQVLVFNSNSKIARKARIEVTELPDTIIDVPFISQVYAYPNGCESVSTVMALNYEGINITVDEFIDEYLDMAPLPEVGEDGEVWGYSPWDYFLGDPRYYSGLCCYAPVIKNALDKFVDEDKYEVLELYDVPLEELCYTYLIQGIPVILWGTMYMSEPYQGYWGWNVTDGYDGEVFKWTFPMHCLLLIGFDGENYYFNDPMVGDKVAYNKWDTEIAYRGLFSQAIVIKRKPG